MGLNVSEESSPAFDEILDWPLKARLPDIVVMGLMIVQRSKSYRASFLVC